MKKSFYLFLVAIFTLAFNNASFAQNKPKTDEPASLKQTHKPVAEKPVREEKKMEVKSQEKKATNAATVQKGEHVKTSNNEAKKTKKRLPKVIATQPQKAANNNSDHQQK
ncbi:MAG TPA: hypothetical protein PK611_01900 [Saprospiraceae bacterium]|nr:hypothetical protein [Saprospiraceae bacterium]HRO09359.1 hypothetical protein [Saprospiraceae bacterium]HRO72403.1 hypothetical protein [Saprospiraceae bacterium]HRP42666.1 hypothetical protein [Saprospiraceae bacterium]